MSHNNDLNAKNESKFVLTEEILPWIVIVRSQMLPFQRFKHAGRDTCTWAKTNFVVSCLVEIKEVKIMETSASNMLTEEFVDFFPSLSVSKNGQLEKALWCCVVYSGVWKWKLFTECCSRDTECPCWYGPLAKLSSINGVFKNVGPGIRTFLWSSTVDADKGDLAVGLLGMRSRGLVDNDVRGWAAVSKKTKK